MYKHRVYQFLRLMLVMAIIFLIYMITQYALSYLYPILFAFLLSLFLTPVVTLLESKCKLPRTLATFIVMILVFSILIGMTIFLTVELIQGTTFLAESMPTYLHTLSQFIENFTEEKLLPLYHKLTSFFHTLGPTQQDAINSQVKQIINQYVSMGTDFLQQVLLQVPLTLTMLPNSITVLVFIIIATFFITNDWNTLTQSLEKMMPKTIHKIGETVWHHLRKAIFGFIKAQLLLISLTAFIIFIGLSLFGIEYSLIIALVAATLDMLPFVGTGIIFIPWIFFLFLTGNYSLTISITVLYMIVVIQRQLLEPKILSNGIGLNPLAALISLFIGLQLWGLLGLFIGPSLLIIMNSFYQAGVVNQIWLFIKG